ncbi:MAG: pectin acetylesterase-family hydrolase [Chloroflexota bacterium]
MYSLSLRRLFLYLLLVSLTFLLLAGCGLRRRPAGRPNQSLQPTQAPQPTTGGQAAAPESAVTPLSDELGVVVLDSPTAVCNDGSPAQYYLRQGQNNNWLVFLEGGGACFQDADCREREREQYNLTSSEQWDPSVSLDGLFSIDPERNPDFWNWNQIYVKYCSSDGWSGNRQSPDGRQFRGQAILEAVLTDLQNHHGNFGAGQGTDSTLILAGCSAGGEGVLNNLDAVAARFTNNFDDIRGINDAGWAVDVQPSYSPQSPSFYDLLGQGFDYWQGHVDADCLGALGDPAQCYFGATAYPFITTPLFVQMHQRDREQISTFHAGTERNADDFAGRVRASLENVTAAFSPAATNHCVTFNDKFWGAQGAEVDGYSMQEALSNWLHDREPIRLVAP